jgi:selenium-binding protein 1
MSLLPPPEEAMAAPQEEFLYLDCLHEGTGVDAPDFIAVVDAEEGRVVHELPMPNAGDELHHFGWNRCSSACHGPDRSPLIVPGFRSSRIHVVNVADDPRRMSVACRSRSHSRRSHRPPASSRWSSARG